MKIGEALTKCSKIANAEGPMELDTSSSFVFHNAVIIFSMRLDDDGVRNLKINVAAGKPNVFDENIDGLLEEKTHDNESSDTSTTVG